MCRFEGNLVFSFDDHQNKYSRFLSLNLLFSFVAREIESMSIALRTEKDGWHTPFASLRSDRGFESRTDVFRYVFFSIDSSNYCRKTMRLTTVVYWPKYLIAKPNLRGVFSFLLIENNVRCWSHRLECKFLSTTSSRFSSSSNFFCNWFTNDERHICLSCFFQILWQPRWTTNSKV